MMHKAKIRPQVPKTKKTSIKILSVQTHIIINTRKKIPIQTISILDMVDFQVWFFKLSIF